MTAQEYNHVFLPQINRAEEFVELFESSIEHMSDTRVDKDEVRKQFQIRGWSEETRQVIQSPSVNFSHKDANLRCSQASENPLKRIAGASDFFVILHYLPAISSTH